MAGIRLVLTKSAVALTLGTAKTVIQAVAASNHRVLLHGFEITFDSVDSTKAPQLVQLIIQTDAGTSSALTPIKRNASDTETLQTTGRHTSTVDPTDSSVKWESYVSPLGGKSQTFRLDSPIPIVGGTRLGLKVTPTASCNCTACFDLEE